MRQVFARPVSMLLAAPALLVLLGLAPARDAAPPNSARCEMFDCNENGIEDVVDIALGSSSDTNGNGVPDECESDAANAPRE